MFFTVCKIRVFLVPHFIKPLTLVRLTLFGFFHTEAIYSVWGMSDKIFRRLIPMVNQYDVSKKNLQNTRFTY